MTKMNIFFKKVAFQIISNNMKIQKNAQYKHNS